jgi:hypothetical protein
VALDVAVDDTYAGPPHSAVIWITQQLSLAVPAPCRIAVLELHAEAFKELGVKHRCRCGGRPFRFNIHHHGDSRLRQFFRRKQTNAYGTANGRKVPQERTCGPTTSTSVS